MLDRSVFMLCEYICIYECASHWTFLQLRFYVFHMQWQDEFFQSYDHITLRGPYQPVFVMHSWLFSIRHGTWYSKMLHYLWKFGSSELSSCCYKLIVVFDCHCYVLSTCSSSSANGDATTRTIWFWADTQGKQSRADCWCCWKWVLLLFGIWIDFLIFKTDEPPAQRGM